MGDGLYERLIRERGYRARIYAPVGGHRDLLAYLVRRLLENGANSSFVHQLADKQVSDRDLLADPVAKVLAVGAERHSSIPLPTELFAPDRRNSEGLDLNDPRELARIAQVVGKPIATQLDPCPTAEDLVATACDGFDEWTARTVEHRANCLDRLADLLERDRDILMAIAVQEAKKTIPDALGEVREAVDFCRYYAQQARVRLQPVTLPGPTGERNVLRMEGRGTWVCIAPWNFPLAIFIGQVAAALAGGNTVVAKPASQTPLIAQHAVRLAHEAGIPTNALLLATGRRDLGQKLMEDVRVAGVAFTGSTSTAKTIARTLLVDDRRPIIPLIAETGGINSMIVDSSALPEQVVQDVVASAFRSAGQRCSALRLLLIQEEVAPAIVRMLSSAMDTLIVGDPADPRTDVGPVIDDASYQRLMSRRSAMRDRIVKTVEVPSGGHFVPPTLIRLDAVEDLEEEWFGPLLHFATWRSGQLRETVGRVNKSGFGLTMGLHSRIARSAKEVEASACVGNLYVNRSMIGAIVGSQPFGGEGLSGTGPKAGGPNYLPRFCTERVTSTDTTSSGGNATLLSLADL
jgi:RHH-type proline utilization regulon transcriptional repressor/proline dehydrogenase/delta 1-pyrroline-5-carboxylate dehydrogenase